MLSKKQKQILVAAVLIISTGLFFALGGGEYLSLAKFQELKGGLVESYQSMTILFIALYALLYIIVAATPIPLATVMTLAGGAIFGWAAATPIIVFSATTGSIASFIIGRFLLQDWIKNSFSGSVDKLNNGLDQSGW